MKLPIHRKFNFSVIGSGNIAWHISHALVNAGHVLQEIVGRNEFTTQALASELNVAAAFDTDFFQSKSEFLILAVPDAAIPVVASTIKIPLNAVLLSLSGSFPLQELSSLCKKSAVFYPLQTFTKKRKLDFSKTPILIESFEPEVIEQVKILATSLSEHVLEISSASREKIHLAAVFSNNFTNYLLSVSKDIIEKEHLNFEILKPLVLETIEKAFIFGPKEGQTGPAVRGDHETWHKHLLLLENEEALKNIYNQLSVLINKSVNID
jgi:predicted short-subunit dehydrogenase-like oxidoreductase (DUF2520 family)